MIVRRVLAGWLAAAATAQAAPPAVPVPVEVATARSARVAPRTWVPGTVVSRDDARIAGLTAGRVMWIADLGQRIAAGAVLARLDDTLAKLRVADLEAQVARARSQAELARLQFERYDSLAATKIYPQSQLDEVRTQREVAQHDVERLGAQLRQAQFDVDQAVIRAPFPGVVTERLAQRGEYLQVGAPLVRLVDVDAVEARATVALAFAGTVRQGQPTKVRSGGEERPATIRAVVPVGDDRSRQFEIRLALDRAAWPVGSAIEVSVPTGGERTAVVVPRDAIVLRTDRSYVMRLAADGITVERRDVEAGVAIDDQVEIRSGVAIGDRLVVRGAEGLESGQAVTVAPPRVESRR